MPRDPRPRRLLAALSILGLAACSDSTEPTPDSVVGSYEATTFTIDAGEGDRDVLADGGYLHLTLAREKTVDGELHVPGGGENGEDLTTDLVGQWVLLEGEVRFYLLPETFVTELPFAVDGGRLTADATVGDTAYFVVLMPGLATE